MPSPPSSVRRAARTAHGPALLDCCRAGIAELLEAGAGMDVVEREIEATDVLGREDRDALWLWAERLRTAAAS